MNGPEPKATPGEGDAFNIVERPLTIWERLYYNAAARQIFVLAVLAALWEGYGRYLDNGLLFPTLSETLKALWEEMTTGHLEGRVWTSLSVLLAGYGLAFVLAVLLTAAANTSLLAQSFLNTVTSILNPLPAIAMLPLALIWFGIGNASLIFVLVHSVLWPLALNMHSGFGAVPETLRMVGRNPGLKGMRYFLTILVPAAFPSILAGLKIGWAFAWRTLLAAELIFGVSSGAGGLGWLIYQRKNQFEIPSVFAALLTVIIVGLVIENLVFRTLENVTVRRWGMQS